MSYFFLIVAVGVMLAAFSVRVDSHFRQLRVFLMAKQAEHAAGLRALNEQLVKARGEIVAKIEALEEAIANQDGETSPEVDAALEALKAQVQGLDDLNPDAPSEEPTPGEGEPTV